MFVKNQIDKNFKGKLMKKLLLFSLLAILAACNGGNGGGSPGGPTTPELNHNELAVKFVQELNLDAEFSVTLAKKSTLQSDFIVIYDPLTDSYDAIDIQSYNPNFDNAADFYFANSARNYFDLDILPGHYETDFRYGVIGYDYDGYPIYGYEPYQIYIPTRYRDRATGITFEKVTASAKDLAKMVAIKEAAEIQKSAEFLSSEFGLSLNRGKELAGLKAHWKKASKKGMTTSEVDSFSTELLGFSLTSGIEAYNASVDGDESQVETLVNQAAEVNGITPEHASKLMTKVFGL